VRSDGHGLSAPSGENNRERDASFGRAAELAGVPVGQMMTILTKYGVESRVEQEDYLQGLHSLSVLVQPEMEKQRSPLV